MKRTAVIRPSTTMNRNTPCGLTADTRSLVSHRTSN